MEQVATLFLFLTLFYFIFIYHIYLHLLVNIFWEAFHCSLLHFLHFHSQHHMFASASPIQLVLDSAEVVLRGGPQSAESEYITGRVVVPSRYAKQLHELVVSLRPQKQRMFQMMHPVTPPICLQNSLMVGGQTEPHILHNVISDGQEHEWRFSLRVPGDTAETVFSHTDYVAYEVVADARVSGTFGVGTQQSKCQSLAIKRTPLSESQWTVAANEPVTESAVWKSRLELTLLAQSRMVHDTQSTLVRGVIRPLEKGVCLLKAGFQILEHVSHNIEGPDGASTKISSQDMVVVDNSIDIPGSQNCLESIELKHGLPLEHEISAARCLAVPEVYTKIQYDVRRGPIRVNHELVLFVTVADRSGAMHNLRLATPVFVLPKLGGEETTPLPLYEHAIDDKLIEAADAAVAERDADLLADYVLVEEGNEDNLSFVDCDILDECPLALEGYQALGGDSLPPPAYPGAAGGNSLAGTIECAMAGPLPLPLPAEEASTKQKRLRMLRSRAKAPRAPHTCHASDQINALISF